MVWWGHYWYLREHVSHKLSRFPAHFSYEPQIGWYLAGTCPGRKCWDNTTVIDLLIYILWLVRERADEFKMRVIFKIDKVAIDTVQSVEWGPSIGMGWKNAFTIYQSTSRAALRTPFGVLFPLFHLASIVTNPTRPLFNSHHQHISIVFPRHVPPTQFCFFLLTTSHSQDVTYNSSFCKCRYRGKR